MTAGSLRDLIRSAMLIGVGNSVRAVGYALDRARLDRRTSDHPRARGLTEPAGSHPGEERPRGGGLAIEEARPGPGSARFTGSGGTLEVRFLADGAVFVGYDGASPSPSYALQRDHPEPAHRVRLSAIPSDDGGGWMVTVLGMREENSPAKPREFAGIDTVVVDRAGGLTFHRGGKDGPVLRRDLPPDRHTGPGVPWRSWVHRSELSGDAVVSGLGGRSAGLNRRPGRYRLWNTDPGGHWGPDTDPLSLTMPVLVTVDDAACVLAFYDNTFDGEVELDDTGATIRMTDGPLRYYVAAGAPADVLDNFTRLTGRPTLPPRWALGYHQSRWGYGSERALREVADGFERRGLPLSGIWLDIDHLVRRRVFEPDPDRYPELAGFAAQLAERDTHLVAIVDPAVPRTRRSTAYESGLAAGAFCRDARGDIARGVVWPGPTAFPDFTSAATRAWWGGLYRSYLDQGVDGFWHDMNEPAAFAAFGDPTLPLSTRHDMDGRGGDHAEAHNVYGLQMNRAGYEGLRRLCPDRRPFLISRSGWVGLQRFAGTWTGDIAGGWESLRTSLTFTLGLGTCGVPFSGPDIGGFDTHPSPELYVRWFQLASFLPFFRTHSSFRVPPREPWEWADTGAATLELIDAALRERYALLPYWYTLAHIAHTTGAPYVRPMFWAHPADRELRKVDDAFLFGDALLVAPVLEAGSTSRTVRLPTGRWYDRRTGEAHDGPGEVSVPTALDDPATAAIPVFARAGAVIPVARADGRITLEAYAPTPDDPAPLGGMLITDSGDGWDVPVTERFTITAGAPGEPPTVAYQGPESTLPYPVDACPRGRS